MDNNNNQQQQQQQQVPPAPSRASKRIKLARAKQEKVQPKSNTSLATLPKSSFIRSVVSALPARDEKFYTIEGITAGRGGPPVAKEVREGVNEAEEETAGWRLASPPPRNSRSDRHDLFLLKKQQLGGGPRHLRQYVATNAEDTAPPKGQGEEERGSGEREREQEKEEGGVFSSCFFFGLNDLFHLAFSLSQKPKK